MDSIKNIVLRPSYAEVDLSQLLNNTQNIKNYTNKRMILVLKANAYGHGMLPLAKFFESNGFDFFGVAFLEEALLLRENGVKSDILVLGGISGKQIEYFIKYNIIITASSVDKLNLINETALKLNTKARVHLKIDTGMERIGVHYYNSDNFFKVAVSCKNIEIEGVFSHFANSEVDVDLTKQQLERFMNSISFFEKNSIKMPLRHIANSGGILTLKESHLDLVRPGIMLYGYYPNPEMEKTIEVKPILSLKSSVVYFKVIKEGVGVSYNWRWVSNKQTRVVTIPIGYGDGYSRSLSNKGEVLIRGKRYKIIGSVCMDQMMVNIENGEAYNQDEVVLIGKQGEEVITCDDLAKIQNTISYEILTQINTRVPRIYKFEGKEVGF